MRCIALGQGLPAALDVLYQSAFSGESYNQWVDVGEVKPNATCYALTYVYISNYNFTSLWRLEDGEATEILYTHPVPNSNKNPIAVRVQDGMVQISQSFMFSHDPGYVRACVIGYR